MTRLKFLLFICATLFFIVGSEAAIERIKNFRIELNDKSKFAMHMSINKNDDEQLSPQAQSQAQLQEQEQAQEQAQAQAQAQEQAQEQEQEQELLSDIASNTRINNENIFPNEMTTEFDAFEKHFKLKLRRNNALITKSKSIDDDLMKNIVEFGAAYIGVTLEVQDQYKSSSLPVVIKDPFARFFATLKDKNVELQGGFEWEKIFFKIGNENHPNTRDHVSPNEISLLKRSSETNTNDIFSDLIILKESTDPRQTKTFGFSFNSGTNSTISFRCGHDDVSFNNDPRGVGNDFAVKLSLLKHEHDHDHEHNHVKIRSNTNTINPLTAQYYLDKRDNNNNNNNSGGCPASRKVIYIGVAADSAYLAKFDGNRQAAISNILSDFNLVSAIYEKSFNVELGIVVITIANSDNAVPWDLPCNSVIGIGDRLNAFSKWRDSQSKDIGLYHLVSGCAESETVGIAWLNQVCQVKSFRIKNSKDVVSGTSVSVLIPNQFAVIAHEFGHNFGAIHDCDLAACQVCRGRDCNCCTCGSCDCKGKFVMNPESGGLNVREFSPCSQSDICYKMNVLGKCLEDPGRLKSLKKSICGNGILEDGEECDCGSEEECKGNPCCSFGCKLKQGAACSDGNSLCCSNCQIRKAEESFICFTSKTRCQSDSICDGNIATCPNSKRALDGSICELDGGKCASGICTSRDLQCRTVGKRLGINRSCKQTPNTCQLICESGTGCVTMSAFFMDGTSCGKNGICSNGKCSESSISGFMEDNSILVLVMGLIVGSLLCVLLLKALLSVSRRRPRP